VHDIGPVWDDEVLADPEVQAAIRDNGTVRREYVVTNQNRSVLGRIGGAVARVHGARTEWSTLRRHLRV
jgi:glutamate synthase (ferredoxin)